MDGLEALKQRMAMFIQNYEQKFQEQQGRIRELEKDNSQLRHQVDDLTAQVMIKTSFIIEEDEKKDAAALK